MWPYESPTREEFEKVKDHVEEIFLSLGAEVADSGTTYLTETVTVANHFVEENRNVRRLLLLNGEYFRISEVLMDKPCIVIECGELVDYRNNTTEDAEPFPYDLSEEELILEVKYSTGMLPYPED